MSQEDFIILACKLGKPQTQLIRSHRKEKHSEISVVSNAHRDTNGDNAPIVLGSYWHTDDSYFASPCAITLLHANKVPIGKGDTLFLDMYAAYQATPLDLKQKISSLQAVHKYQSRRNMSKVPKLTIDELNMTPDVIHPLIRTHPETGLKSLYLNPNRIDHIVDLCTKESDLLLDQLLKIAIDNSRMYRHNWLPGDILIWDNRCTMHRVENNFGSSPREMMRILLQGTAPV